MDKENLIREINNLKYLHDGLTYEHQRSARFDLKQRIIDLQNELEALNKREITEVASKKVCKILFDKFLSEEEKTVHAFDENYLIERYTDEWSWFMQGWHEAIEFMKETN